MDNSADACHAEAGAVALAQATQGAEITGCHVCSGVFHGLRFQALEGYLPAEYRTPETLEYQRRIHSFLIGRGLRTLLGQPGDPVLLGLPLVTLSALYGLLVAVARRY